MKILLVCIFMMIFSMSLCAVIELQFLDWPLSKDNQKFVLIAGSAVGLISLFPLVGVKEARLKKSVLLSLSVSLLCAFFYYIFNLVLFTI